MKICNIIKDFKHPNIKYVYDLGVDGNENFFCDGVLKHNCRTVVMYEKDSIEFFSRQGQLIEGLNDIADEVSRYLLPGYVYDGELLLRNDKNLESKDLYRATVKVVNADGEKKNVIFNIFDMLPISDFKNGISMSNSFERKMLIHNLFNNCKPQWLKEVEML